MRIRFALVLSLSALAATDAASAAEPLHGWTGASSGRFGYSVSCVGDVNGDGRDDVVIGAPDASIYAPHVEVRSGAGGELLWALYDTTNGLPGGVFAMTRLGISVAGIGDLNGDGIPDVVAGAHADSRERHRSGSVRAYSGLDGALLWEAFGGRVYDEMGYRIAGAGDVDLDGVDDVVAGSLTPLSIRRTVAVLSGRDGSVLHLILEPSAPDAEGLYANFGSAVAGLGDVNADGHPDFAVGATHDDRNGVDAGSVTVYSGRSGLEVYTVRGDRTGDLLGISVDSIGDLDGDGRAEFVAGATGAESPHGVEDAGMARVYDGRTGRPLRTIHGDERDRFLGISVAGVGDMNRDGFMDFAAGTFGYPLTVGEERGDYVEVRSGVDGSLLGRLRSSGRHDGFGFSIAGRGDLNGDGFADLVVGAFQSFVDRAESGRVEAFGGRPQHGIVAEAPSPGIAGGSNSVVIRGARPGAELEIYVGRRIAATPIAGCPAGRALSIRNPNRYGTVRADANGEAVLRGSVDSGQKGRPVLVQAFEPETCRISTLMTHEWK